MSNKTENTNNENKPNWRLVQEKAYYRMDRNGQKICETKNIELAVGWQKASENGSNYISWSDSVTPVLPDVDGRIVTRAFEINHDN